MSDRYGKLDKKGIEFLQTITCRDRVYWGDKISEEYSHDEMPEYGVFQPDAVVEVESAREVSDIMNFADKKEIPVVPRGAGTGLAGGAVAINGGIVISMVRMNRIIGFDEDNLTVDVEPGVLLMDLASAALERDLFYPPDPGEKTATIGGNVMCNAGGMRAVKYGVTKDYVRAIEAVLPDGEIVHFSSNVAKNTSGYNIKDLVVGSEGTLCIATRITLRLIPLPKKSNSLVVPFPSLEKCIETVPLFFKNKLIPTAIEFIQRDVISAAEEYLGKFFPEKSSDYYLILTFDGNSREELDKDCETAARICLDNDALDVYLCDTDERKEAVWSVRGACLEAIKCSTTQLDECDVVVPRNRIPDFVRFAKKVSTEGGVRITTIGHAGDGNIHVSICRDDLDEKSWQERVGFIMTQLYKKAAELGGQVSGEHGIGHVRIDALQNSVGERSYDLFKAVKLAFDPKSILNPGKVVQTAEALMAGLPN